MLPDDSAAVSYWKFGHAQRDEQKERLRTIEQRIVAFVVTRDGAFTSIDLGPAAKIEQAARDWRKQILAGRERGVVVADAGPAAGQQLRRLVFDPLRPALGKTTKLVVALDDVLHLVPLDALPDGDDRRLGDTFTIDVRTSLRELLVPARPLNGEPGLLALGGIDYDLAPIEGESKADADPGRDRSASSSPAQPFEWAFDELPASTMEVRAIASRFGKAHPEASSAVVLEGRRATRIRFEELASQYRFLHLATHGYFTRESVPSTRDEREVDGELGLRFVGDQRQRVIGLTPMTLGGLAFAGANRVPATPEQKGAIMTAEEVAALSLAQCELAVLSACDTSIGERRAGQGIASLREALFAAGARSTITSLWAVPDEAARELMSDFYRRLWLQGKPKAQALWEAKAKLRGEKDAFGEPRYALRDWAGWVLSGETN